MLEIAAKLNTTYGTVRKALELSIAPEEYDRLKRAYYSRSKTGNMNPMYGAKTAAERILRTGRLASWNGNGYTMKHRTIMMKALGLSAWPEGWEVHHIDGDKLNNELDNLALVTKSGHQKLHKQKLGRLYLWEKETFGTSVLSEMKAMWPKE
jgi:HNH endonuclease